MCGRQMNMCIHHTKVILTEIWLIPATANSVVILIFSHIRLAMMSTVGSYILATFDITPR